MATTLIRNATEILTMEPGAPRFGPGDVLVEDARIRDVVRADAPSRPSPDDADTVLDASGMLVMPGLVNTHHHFFQSLTRILPDMQNRRLFDWLVGHYDVWLGYTGEMLDVAARVALGELLLTGCTTTADHHYLFPTGAARDLIDREIAAARELGIRFHPTRGSMEMGRTQGGLPPDGLVESLDRVLDDSRRVIDRYHDPDPLAMCRVALAPCAPFNVSEALMRETATLARARGVRLHTHLGETREEIADCLMRYACRPFAYADRLGWIDGDVWLAHAVYFDDDEIAEMGRRGVGVAHCPSSNARLGSGIAPVRRLLEAGVAVGIGVDGSASNDASNLTAELHQALLVHRFGGDDAWLDAEEVMHLATTGGAAVLGRDDIGMLRRGLAADLVLVDLEQLSYAGALADPLAAIVFSLPLRPVHTTLVNGRVVVRDGRLVGTDERALAREAHRLAAELGERVRRA